MAGIVNPNSELIVTGGGGGGGNSTIVGPLGSRPAAASVSVALASDQIPLPVAFNNDGNTGSSPVTFSNGVGGPITIPTPGEGSVVVKVLFTGPLTGNLTFQEQLITGGTFSDALVQVVAGGISSFPLSKYEIFEGSVPANYASVFYTALVRARGINIRIGNGITGGAGNLVITAIFKSGAAWNVGTLINGISGIAADVTTENELATTLLKTAGLVQAGDGLQSDNFPPPNIGEGGPLVGAVPLLVNPTLGYDRQPGDTTFGAWVNVKNSVPLTVGPSTPISVTGTITAAGQLLPINTDNANTVVVTISANSGGGIFGQINFEGTNDNGAHWEQVYTKLLIGYAFGIDGSMITSLDPSGVVVGITVFIIPCAGFQQVRLNAQTFGGGTISFVLTTSSSDSLHDNVVRLVPGDNPSDPIFASITGLTGTNAPADLIPNPGNLIGAESFLMGWDATNGTWSRVNVDYLTGKLLVHTDSGVTRTPVSGSPNFITTSGQTFIVTISSQTQAGGGRGTVTFTGTYTGITAKLFVVSPSSPSIYLPILIRNVATRVVSLDTGVLNSDGVTTSYTYEFHIPTGMNVVIQSTSFISGFATYTVLYDDLPLENLMLASDPPPASAIVSGSNPSYIPGSNQSLSINQDGRLRVISSTEPELDFFNSGNILAEMANNPFIFDNPWS